MSDTPPESAGTVICLHSGGFTSRQWKRLAAVLASTHRVLTPDLLGYGPDPSERWPAGQPFERAQDLAALSTLLASVAGPLHLVGHSYGGFLAAQLARTRTIASLSMYEPVTFSVLDPVRDAAELAALAVKATWDPDPATGSDEAWFTSFVDWWNGPGAWANLPAEAAASFRRVGWKLFEEVRSLASDTTGAAGFATITAPTLVLGGTRSPPTERRTIERLVEAIPHAELRIIDGAGHMGPITHHAIVNAAIAAHVRAH